MLSEAFTNTKVLSNPRQKNPQILQIRAHIDSGKMLTS